jgi:hypothetical protein
MDSRMMFLPSNRHEEVLGHLRGELGETPDDLGEKIVDPC